MSSRSASQEETEAHVVRTAMVRVVTTARVAAVMIEVQEVHVASVLPRLLSRTTNLRCSKHLRH
jgi:hypothetical protein